MMLKSFGCSFIFGSDLSDDVSHNMLDWSENGVYIRPSKLTWPALLAKHYHYDYLSRALPGIGNLQILESVLKELDKANNDLFVIQWTWIDRFDYENIIRSNRDNFWNTIRPGCQDDVSEYYYKNIHSQYRDKLTNLLYIKTAIDVLTQNNIPFIMTNIDDLVFEDQWHSNVVITSLQNQIKASITTFDGVNFLEWAKSKGFSFSKTLHPLDDAHAAAAENIINQCLV